MTFTDAACEVLRKSGRPLHYKEITEIAIEQNLLSHVGKSPEVTMGARLAATLKKGGDDNVLIRVKPGVFALRDWDEATIKKGLDIKRTAPKPASKPPVEDSSKAADAEVGTEAAAPQGDNGQASGVVVTVADGPADADVDDVPPAADETRRAEMAASGTEVFAEEEDDDQPILKPVEDESSDSSEEQPEGRRRRRRRRRRGSRSTGSENGESLPTYVATPAFDKEGAAPRGPQVIEVTPTEMPALDGVAGEDLADGVVVILGTFDRTVGAVSLRQISETAQRRGKLSSDLQLAQSQIAAAVRADNARRAAAGRRPRFRMAGGRVGLTDWLLDSDLARLEREALKALGRYRDASRRAFARKCSELPGHAFVELCMLMLECVGVSDIRHVKYPGASGAEAHLSGVIHVPAGRLPGLVGAGAGIKLAIVIRKDGRNLGRERVTELRGSAHHYGGAEAGWLITTGQVLSGAREEATVAGSIPITLLEGVAIAELCEEHGVAVVRAEHPIAIPDVDLFEALRST